MKHYIIKLDWAFDGESDAEIKGIAHTLDEAKDVFRKFVVEEKQLADENGWEVFTDNETCFDAGEEGWYGGNHTCLSIEGI